MPNTPLSTAETSANADLFWHFAVFGAGFHPDGERLIRARILAGLSSAAIEVGGFHPPAVGVVNSPRRVLASRNEIYRRDAPHQYWR